MSADLHLVPAGREIAGMLPFDEQTALDVAAGRRQAYELQLIPADLLAGYGVLGRHALDLEVLQELRTRGHGTRAAELLLDLAGSTPLTAWSHGDHPAARALAARFGFRVARTLHRMAAPGLGRPSEPGPSAGIAAFRPGVDDEEWVALNARVFAGHPEQGAVTVSDLHERMAEPWFRADDFLVARDADGAMVGYCWTKFEPGADAGEIYVLGVSDSARGTGLADRLLSAAAARRTPRGGWFLYVDGDNERAIRLYQRRGFEVVETHVQYAR